MHSMEEEDGVDVDMVGCGWIVTKYLVASPPWLLVVVFFFANGEQIGHQIRTEGHPQWKGHRTRTKAQHHTLLHCSGLLQSILMMEY